MKKYQLLIIISFCSLLFFHSFKINLFLAHEDTYSLNICVRKCTNELKFPASASNSLCGPSADRRGYSQKVVSFSFYGEMKTKYYRGISFNLMTMQEFYPNWTMRLYGDWTIEDVNLTNVARDSVCSLYCQNTERLDICSVRNLPNFGDLHETFGMIWRFLPLADPTVDFMAVRDLDSRFSKREMDAVKDWLSSDFPFHAMRDHPHHNPWILGGMWGARMDLGNREKYSNTLKDIIKKAGKGEKTWKKGQDQVMLSQVVWPVVKNEALVHDSYFCKQLKSAHLRAFPSRREMIPCNYVGADNCGSENVLKKECPQGCRPQDHQDWINC